MIRLAEDRFVAVLEDLPPPHSSDVDVVHRHRRVDAGLPGHGSPHGSYRALRKAYGMAVLSPAFEKPKPPRSSLIFLTLGTFSLTITPVFNTKASRMQPDLNSLQAILRTRRAELSRDYAVAAIDIFGSYARGSATDQSDLDIVVEFDRPIGFFKFLELEVRRASGWASRWIW
jgi:hypothetical protein